MKCLKTARWLRENPGKPAPEGLRDHAAGCPDCREVLAEQLALDASLRGLPAIEPPAFFETRLKAAVFPGQGRALPGWRPALVPLAALLVAAGAAALITFRHSSGPGPVSEAPLEIVIHDDPPVGGPPVVPSVTAAEPTDIYPVWPGDGDVVSGEDLSIMASLYPAPRPGTSVSVTMNHRDVPAMIRSAGELVTFSPGRVDPGRHVVTITLREADGETRSLTYSFFALEAQS